MALREGVTDCDIFCPAYSDKRKQLLKVTFHVNEQNVFVMYIDINANIIMS